MGARGVPRTAGLLGGGTLIIVGFILGGIALPIGPTWVLFWIGAGIVVVAAILAAAIRIMDDWY